MHHLSNFKLLINTRSNTHRHTPQQSVEVLQTYCPVRTVWEVDGTLLMGRYLRCDVTAMASAGWLEGQALVIELPCLVILNLWYFIQVRDRDGDISHIRKENRHCRTADKTLTQEEI